jgi:hypothetical protein
MTPLNIIIIVIVIILILMILRYILYNPYNLQGLQNGQTASVISASSLATNGTSIPASNFAYSIWYYVNDWNYRYGEPKVIFGRMGSSSATNGTSSVSGISGLDPCPAVVLGAVENNIAVSLGCYPGINQEPTTTGGSTVVSTCLVANVPIQKWVNLIVSVYNRTMDIYIDGKLVKTCMLPGVAAVNNNSDVYVTPSGGFDGWTSKFQYYPNPLNPQQAWNIYSSGYSSSWFNMSQTYQIQLSLIENGTTQNTVTI